MDVLEQHEEQEQRPTFLKVLCILSWIYIGASLLGNLFSWIGGKLSPDEMREQVVQLKASVGEMKKIGWDSFAQMIEQSIPLTQQMNDSFYTVHSVNLVMLIIGLIGVVWMWQGKKLGFHLYIIYSLIALGAIYLYASPSNVNSASQLVNAIISGAFIFMYSRNLSWMKK